MRDNDRQITEVTRRNIADSLAMHRVNWAGRFEEQQFLARLFDLSSMRSTDSRYSLAADDIWKHRVVNSDWEDDWVFYDSRFNLIGASDEDFLRFLCEMLHPAVQPSAEEVQRILAIINPPLSSDGWKLQPQLHISGRPVFAAARIVEVDAYHAATAMVVTNTIDSDYVGRQITRMQAATEAESDVAIGTAKEFVETIAKTILRERGVAFDSGESMPRLVKQAAAQLELLPLALQNEGKATETIRRLLSNMGAVSDGIAELRNLHGTGHGKDAATIGLEARHARLAVGAATSLAVFLWESHTAGR